MNKKNILTSIGIIIIVAIGIFFMMRDSVKAPIQSLKIEENGHKPVVGYGEYIINKTESVLEARGQKPLISGYTDISTSKFKEGLITVTNGKITGSFIVDMNLITVESTGKKSGESMLEKHLKSSDFFDVENYPESVFKITSAEKTVEDDLYIVTGDLTLKGVTAPITFPAVIYMKDGQLKAEGTIGLNRTQWNIKYGSGSFFKELGDNLISDIFTVEFKLVADLKK